MANTKKVKKHLPMLEAGKRWQDRAQLTDKLSDAYSCEELLLSLSRILAGEGIRLQAMVDAALKAHAKEMEEHRRERGGFYPCLNLHRDDVEMAGADMNHVTAAEMEMLANKMEDAVMTTFWDSLNQLIDDNDIPRKKED